MTDEKKLKEMVDHLKNYHKSKECQTNGNGKATVRRALPLPPGGDANWAPHIFRFNNQIFILQAYMRDHTCIFWVAILGTKDEAEKYKVRMSIPEKADQRFSMVFRGKVFNANEMKNLLEGRKDVLRLDYSLAEERLDDNSEFKIDYHIMRK